MYCKKSNQPMPGLCSVILENSELVTLRTREAWNQSYIVKCKCQPGEESL